MRIYLRDSVARWSAVVAAGAVAAHQFYIDNKDAINAAVPITLVGFVVVLLAVIRSAPEIKKTKEADNTGEGEEQA